jgi:uncharacterized damage-inducible protein DinB
MKTELQLLQEQLTETYNGEPWYGRSLLSILNEVATKHAWAVKVNNNHNNTVLLYHIINWRLFTISRFAKDALETTAHFEENNFPQFPQPTEAVWRNGLQSLAVTQQNLIDKLVKNTDEILEKKVPGREYNFRVLLNGIIQHDIYHIGQIMVSLK